MKRKVDPSGGKKREKPRFVPSYESDPKESMRFILSNEYMRIWFKERDLFLKENQSNQEKIMTETKIKRRYVQRMMTFRKQRDLPSLKLKKFQDVPSKIDHHRAEHLPKSGGEKGKNYARTKFKAQCEEKPERPKDENQAGSSAAA